MNRVIILEGPDGGGKTTLAETLVEAYGFKREHEGVPNPRWDSDQLFRHYVLTLWKALLRRDQPVVFDRHYLGETIYGPVMRGKSLLTKLQVRLIERLVRARDVKVCLVLPPRQRAFDNWKAKHADYVDREEKWHAIYTAYEDLTRYDPYVDYDYTRTNRDLDKNELTDSDQWINLFAPRIQLPKDVVGSPTANLLVVGEQINKRVTSTDWAFFATGASSGFLNQALEGIPEENLAFVNALNPSDEEREFQPVISRLQNFQTAVALGQTAARVLKKQGITYHQLPHPSNVRRFHGNGKLQTYSNLFKEILYNPGGKKLCVTKL